MAKKFKLEIVTPTKKFFDDEVTFIKFNALSGTIGVLANHEPTLIANKATIMRIQNENEKKHAYISEGIVEITNEKVSIVVDMADWAEDINEQRAIKDKRKAEEELENKQLDTSRKLELMASIERANAQIQTANFK